MAQRRVNVKAVGIILAVTVGLLGTMALATKVLNHKDPKKYIALAERFHAENNLQEEAANYKLAVDADPKNLAVRVKYGDVLHRLARMDDAVARQDRAVWDSVLTIDPTNKDALERMLQSEIEIVEFTSGNPDPKAFTRLHELAEKILKLPLDTGKDEAEKKNNAELKARARAYLHISVIAGWFADIITPDEVIKDNTASLEKLLAEDLAISEKDETHVINPDVPYYLGSAYVKQAREYRTRGEDKEAQKRERQAYSMFDKVVAHQPKNAVVRLRFSQVLRSISDSQDDDSKDDRQEYLKKMRTVLEQAREFVKPEDPAFTEVYVFYSNFLLRSKDGEGSEKLLRELLAKKPEDQTARMQLAGVLHLTPGKRDEAVKLLKLPVTDTGDGIVLSLRTKTAMERETLLALTTYLIEEFSSTSDQAKRDELAKEIDESYHKLTDRMGVNPVTLTLKGKIALAKGGRNGAIEAIPEFEKAREMWKVLNPNKKVSDWNLEYLLARAYFDSNQTGVARERLQEIVDSLPNEIQPRVLLTELQVRDHDLEFARENLKELKRIAPTDPSVNRLGMMIYFAEPTKLSKDEIERGLAMMPEKTIAEKRTKAPVFIAAGKIDDAVRLYEEVRADNPADIDIVRTLCQIYMAQQKKDLATKVADDALAKDPKDPSLLIVRALIDNDKEKVKQLTLDAIAGISKPFEREMSFYDYYNSHDNRPEALKHLDAAEKLDPENTRIMDLRFTEGLVDHDWAKAEQYVNKLALKNMDEAHGLIYRYRLALAQGNFKLAEAHSLELVKTLPQFAQSWLCYGEVLKEQKQFEEAANKFQMALQKQLENLEAYRGLVECYYEMKKPDEAKRYIESGLKVLPGNAWLTEQKVAWELNYGDPVKALEPRREAAEKNPDGLGAQLAYGAALWQIAQNYAIKDKQQEADKFTKQASDVLDAIIVKWPDDRYAYAYRADIAIYTNNFAAGEKALKGLVARPVMKGQPDAIIMLADFYARFGKNDLAEASYTEALGLLKSKTDPAGTDLARRIASFYASIRKTDKAMEVLKPVESDRRVQQQMIEILMGDNKLTEAKAILDKRLAGNPDDPQFLATKGFLLMMEKKTPEALVALDRSITLEPRNQVALYYRGMIKMRQGPTQLAEAIKDLTAARDSADDPRSQASVASQIQTRVALSEGYRANNQVEEAVHELQMCVQSQPVNKEIRIRLIELLGTLASPRWGEVDRLIAEAQKMKEYEKDPDWPRLKASEYVSRNMPDKALESIRDAINLAKGQPQRILPLMQDYLNILNRLKKYRDLYAECNELLKNPELARTSWWVYQMRGVANSYTDGKRTEAINDFDKALEIAGRLKSDDAVAVIIQSIADSIGLDAAIDRCEREAAKGDNHWRVILTYLYFTKKDYKRAEETIELVLAQPAKLTPSEKDAAYGVAGSVYMLTGNYEKARVVYGELLKANEKDTVALNNLACIYAECLPKPDTKEALKYSGRAIEVMQERAAPDANILDTHGWILTCDGQPEKGSEFLLASIARKPMLEAHYHLGVALLNQSKGIESQLQLEKARRMLEDKKNKGQPTDPKLETNLNDALVRVKLLVNSPTTAPVSSGTGDATKP